MSVTKEPAQLRSIIALIPEAFCFFHHDAVLESAAHDHTLAAGGLAAVLGLLLALAVAGALAVAVAVAAAAASAVELDAVA